MKQTVEYIVRQLVDLPDAVDVVEIPGDESVTYEVRVAPDDLGKVIGKQGRIANAIRTIVKAVAMKDKQKVFVEIVA
ncbi:MAG: KH domain-containing protein [Armatimonadota bacterium]